MSLLFETIKCENFNIHNLKYHNIRFNQSKKELFGCNTAIDLKEFIKPPSKELLKCKLIYSSSKIESIEFTPYIKKSIKTLKLIENNSINYPYKYLNRDIIDSCYSKKEDCDDIIIIKNGLVTDTSIANIAIFINNEWFTPQTPLLYGTIRAKYLDQGLLKTKEISIDDLYSASKIALLNAMIGFDILDKVEIL